MAPTQALQPNHRRIVAGPYVVGMTLELIDLDSAAMGPIRLQQSAQWRQPN